MRRSKALLLVCVAGVGIGATAYFLAWSQMADGWVQVPRAVHEYDELLGKEQVICGLLEINDRVVLAVPKEGKPTFISEIEVDRISSQGLSDLYLNFYKKGWTHRIRLQAANVSPSFEVNGSKYYLIISSGTEAWKSSDVLNKFVGKQVEIRGKWDSFVIPEYARAEGVTQFRPRSIREAR